MAKAKSYSEREADRKAAGTKEWQRDYSARMKTAGFRQLKVWVHQDDYAREQARLNKLREQRMPKID